MMPSDPPRTNVWSVAPVKLQPHVILQYWSVYEVSQPGVDERVTIHLVGYSPVHEEGRVTSPIKEYDPKTRRARSSRGRIYELQGEPGRHPDAQHTWAHWKAIHSVTAVDITPQLFNTGFSK